MRIAFVVPHIFMQDALLEDVIFSPGDLTHLMVDGLVDAGHEVTLYSPGTVASKAVNRPSDLSEFEDELKLRGYGLTELLKKHPLTFATLARQVQSDVISRAYADANAGEHDVVHVYTNEEDIALHFAQFCNVPTVFTHHDPFSLTIGYKRLFPHFSHLNWISMSMAQRAEMPQGTNWVANIGHGVPEGLFKQGPGGDYLVYLGRVIEAKGVHHAVAAVKEHNSRTGDNLKLKIAGKHYAGHDNYFATKIEPELNDQIEYVGYVKDKAMVQELLGDAKGVLMPSVFSEPFGIVATEALACGTPVIGLQSGALPELIDNGRTGYLVSKEAPEKIAELMADAIAKLDQIDRDVCRAEFEDKHTADRMISDHIAVYEQLTK